MLFRSETSFINNFELLEIEKFIGGVDIISQSSIINVSDLPEITFSKITGNLPVARIEGLDTYLDHYSFDCGTP